MGKSIFHHLKLKNRKIIENILFPYFLHRKEIRADSMFIVICFQTNNNRVSEEKENI